MQQLMHYEKKMQQLRDELEQVKDDLERSRKELEKERHGREVVSLVDFDKFLFYKKKILG